MTLLLLLAQQPPVHWPLLKAAEEFTASARPIDHQVAVVLAQTAMEVRCEQAFDQLIKEAPQRDVALWARKQLRTFDLGNERVRDLYVALSGHRIQDDEAEQPQVWQDFLRHVKLRQEVVHAGRGVTQAQAQASVTSVRGVLERLERHLARE